MPDNIAPELDPRRPRAERTVAALFADLVDQAGLLIRQEFALLGAELDEKFGRFGQGIAALAVGAGLLLSGWFVLLAAAVLGLALVVAPWLAALIVGLVALALGGIVLLIGRRRLAAGKLVPQRTLRSLREDEHWVRERLG